MTHTPRTDASLLPRTMRTLEEDARLDAAVDALSPVANRLVAAAPLRDALLGRSLGHAVHPLLTDLPIGFWTSATVLDLTGGGRSHDAARRLVGLGVLSAVPTVLTGVAEWAVADRQSRRVGVVHAAANAAGLWLNVASWQSRRHGHHRAGLVLTLAANAAVAVGGQLGGHLTLVRHLGSRT